jgi:RNA polymerase sigma-70 factor, ECF subfamily
MDNTSRDELIALSRQRGEQGIGSLLDLYRNYLLLLARAEVGKRLQRKVDASDLVQDTCLDAHRYFERFEGTTEAQFLAWLKTILAGKVADTVRHYLGTQSRDVRRELENDLTESFDRSGRRLEQFAVGSGDRPSQHVMRREQTVIVADALQLLPPDYREVMIFRHWEDLSFPEIAERMDRSLDSVQKLWIRALARLRVTVGAMT